jgi:CheY-like chemotaxis protein
MAKRVLIADDEPNIVTSLEFLMEEAGLEVQIARNGQEALDMAVSFAPDLVLLDVMMPCSTATRCASASRAIRRRATCAC